MTQIYSDPTREDESWALPDVEVFYVSQLVVNYNLANLDHLDDGIITETGWYWWSCFPGCLPDSDAFGPYETEEAATEDAQGAN